MAWEYSVKTKQLFMDAVHGKPGTHLGEIEDPDGMGEHGSIACGDAMRFAFRVRRHPADPAQDVITDARYFPRWWPIFANFRPIGIKRGTRRGTMPRN